MTALRELPGEPGAQCPPSRSDSHDDRGSVVPVSILEPPWCGGVGVAVLAGATIGTGEAVDDCVDALTGRRGIVSGQTALEECTRVNHGGIRHRPGNRAEPAFCPA